MVKKISMEEGGEREISLDASVKSLCVSVSVCVCACKFYTVDHVGCMENNLKPSIYNDDVVHDNTSYFDFLLPL